MRYNGGGQAADYIIDVLQRDFDGYSTTSPASACHSRVPRGHLGTEGDDHQ